MIPRHNVILQVYSVKCVVQIKTTHKLFVFLDSFLFAFILNILKGYSHLRHIWHTHKAPIVVKGSYGNSIAKRPMLFPLLGTWGAAT